MLDGNEVGRNAGPGIHYLHYSSGIARNNTIMENSVNYDVYRAGQGREISAGGIVLGMYGAAHQPWPVVEQNNRYRGDETAA